MIEFTATRVYAALQTSRESAPAHHSDHTGVSTPSTAETGSATRATRAGVVRRSSRGSATEASRPPTAQAPYTRPNRRPSVPRPSCRSIQTTISATNPPPPKHWVKPTTVIVRTPACCHRKDSPSRMSTRTCRGVSGGRSRLLSCSGRVMPEMSAAETRKDSASTSSRVAGCSTARATPTAAGITTSTTPCSDHT